MEDPITVTLNIQPPKMIPVVLKFTEDDVARFRASCQTQGDQRRKLDATHSDWCRA